MKTNSSKKSSKGQNSTPETMTLELPPIDIKQVTFEIQGVTPLIVNKFSEKAIQMIVDKQMKKATKGREAKKPDELYKNSIYWFRDKKRTGFPAVGFKAAMVRAAKQLGLAMTDVRGRFHVAADEGDLVQLTGKHEMRDDMVRLASGVADIRFRATYPKWGAKVTISYNSTAISKEQLAQLLNTAGFACGIGEWRPEKSNSGSFGMFKVI